MTLCESGITPVHNHFRKSSVISSKAKHALLYGSVIPLPVIYLRETKACPETLTVKITNNPNVYQQLSQQVTVEYYTAMKGNVLVK